MTTVAEHALSQVQDALKRIEGLADAVKGPINVFSNQINQLQVAAAANPTLQPQVLSELDNMSKRLSALSELRQLMPEGSEAQAKFDDLIEKLRAYLAAERDETINGPQPVKQWYEEPGFIALWTILGLLLLALIVVAIVYAVRAARKSKDAKDQQRQEFQLDRLYEEST